MNKFKLAIGLHNHQPVGNFDFVFDESHQKAYKPFLDLLAKYPNIRISLHQSGILWDWQEKHQPEYIKKIQKLVDKRQIKLMTGGFYEPILVSIPENDSYGQIEKLDSYIQKKFNVTTQGAWLTERIWEPHLPKILNKAGIKFIPVDDTHFIYAGFDEDQLTGPFITEFEGKELTLLPISKRMRYLIPFGTVDEVITELKTMAEKNPNGMVVYADDGEKFGSWPKTSDHCYKDKWLQKLFDAVTENSDWLEIIPLSEAAELEPVGRAYLPSASYAEMLHWSLPSKPFIEYEKFEKFLKEHGKDKSFGRFVRGGHWRGFLTKYEEVNLMHKKMLYISNKLDKIEDKKTEIFIKAQDNLYAAQCNCPYWHGVFGGLYLPHIRAAVYSHLVEAESLIRQMEKKKLSIHSLDFDCDGHDEIIVETNKLTSVFKPNSGGAMIELSLLDKKFSLTDTLTRRKEGYHLKLEQAVTEDKAGESKSIHDLVLTKEDGLSDFLQEDWYLKRCFIDHVFTDDVGFKTFQSNKFGEYGDFVLEAYNTNIFNNKITLIREGKIRRIDGEIGLTIEKSFIFSDNSKTIGVVYRLTADCDNPIDINFGIENNFNFQAGHAIDRFVLIDNEQPNDAYLDSSGERQDAHSVGLVDQYRDIGVALYSQEKTTIWHLPIFTVSLSEGGFEKVYQGTTIVNQFNLKVSKKPVELKFTLIVGKESTVRRFLEKSETAVS